jgi:hypothetical protein
VKLGNESPTADEDSSRGSPIPSSPSHSSHPGTVPAAAVVSE